MAAISAVIPSIGRDLGLSDLEVAKLVPYYMIPYGIGALLCVPLTRYFSYRSILVLSMAFFAVSSALCAVLNSLPYLLWGRIVMGISAAGITPLALMMMSEFFDKNIRGRVVGAFFSCSFFASLAGVALSGVADWRLLFWVPAALGTLLALGFQYYGTELTNKVHGVTIDYVKAIRNPAIGKIFLFIFVISLFYHGVRNWFGVYLSQIYHLDKFTISLYFILIAIGGMVGQSLGGFLSDKKGRFITAQIGGVGLGISTMLLFGQFHFVILGLILVLISVFWTINHNGISTILTDFSQHERGEIAGLNSSVRFLAGGIGFSITKIFVEKSFSFTFLGIGFLMLVASLFLKRLLPST